MPIFVANEKNTVKGRKQPCFSLLFTLTKLFMYELVGHTSVITPHHHAESPFSTIPACYLLFQIDQLFHSLELKQDRGSGRGRAIKNENHSFKIPQVLLLGLLCVLSKSIFAKWARSTSQKQEYRTVIRLVLSCTNGATLSKEKTNLFCNVLLLTPTTADFELLTKGRVN